MKPRSLPKACLIRQKSEFDTVYRHGKRVHGKHFSLILLPNNTTHNRLGISIHGQLKGAAKRNRIKRIIREFFRLNKDFLQEQSSGKGELPYMDVVITVRQGFDLKTPQEAAEAFGRLLRTRNTFVAADSQGAHSPPARKNDSAGKA